MFKKNKTRVGKRVTKLLQNTDNLIHKFGEKIGKMIAKEWSPCCGVCRINGYFTDSDGNPATTIGDPVELGALLSEFLGEHFIAYVYQSGNFEIIGTEKTREDKRCNLEYFQQTYDGFKVGKDGVLSLDLGALGESEPEFRPYIQTIEATSPYEIFLDPAYTYDFTIDWGDGTVEQITTWDDPRLNHDYAVSGFYQIKVYGIFPYFHNGAYVNWGQVIKCKSIDQWGDIAWESFENTYHSSQDLEYLATDLPNLTNCVSTRYMFNSSLQKHFRGIVPVSNIGSWDVSNVEDMESMFSTSVLDEDLSSWDVSSVKNTRGMFSNGVFNNGGSDGIRNWNFENLENAQAMFSSNRFFNQPVDGWGMGKCTDMSFMFFNAFMFNQDLGSWDVSKVESMRVMFASFGLSDSSNYEARLNQTFNNGGSDSIRNWVTTSLKDTSSMFQWAVNFNQPLDGWDTSNVTNMGSMFRGAVSFNQDLGNWDISSLVSPFSFFNEYGGFSPENFSKTLIGWTGWNGSTATKFVPSGKSLTINSYTTENPLTIGAKNYLTTTKGWTVNDLGSNRVVTHGGEDALIFTINTTFTNPNTATPSNAYQIKTRTGPSPAPQPPYNFNVDWGDGSPIQTGNTGDTTHVYSTGGVYTIKITGDFSGFYHAFTPNDSNKIIEINNWGEKIVYRNVDHLLGGSLFVEIKASDTPNFDPPDPSNFDARYAFDNCQSMKDPTNNLGKWDVSKITSCTTMFQNCFSVDPFLNNWDVSNVRWMNYMFAECRSMGIRNQSGFWKWDVSKVERMDRMFRGCTSPPGQRAGKWFIPNWDTSSCVTFWEMFYNTTMSNPLDKWDWGAICDPTSGCLNGGIRDMFRISGYDRLNGSMGSSFEQENARRLYSSILISISGWSNGAPTKTVPVGQIFHTNFNAFAYNNCPEVVAARNYLLSQGWTIVDSSFSVSPAQCTLLDFYEYSNSYFTKSYPFYHPDYTNWPN